MMNSGKRLLMRWVGWFFFANIILSIMIQASYLVIIPALSAVHGATIGNLSLAYFFLAVSYIAHATIINGVAALVVLFFAWLIPRKGFVFSLATLLGLAVLIAQVLDRFAYRLYHSHQFVVGVTILKSGALGEEIPLSTVEYAFFAFVIVAIIIIELLIARYVWRRLKHSTMMRRKTGIKVGIVLVSTVCISYVLMAFVVVVPPKYRFDDTDSHLLLKMARLVPYYQIVYNWLVPGSYSDHRVWKTATAQVSIQTDQTNNPLHYPLHPMRCSPPKKKPNILFLVFDTLRYDAMNPTVMPNMSRFAKKTVQFDDVYSGGNCTQPGVFSLFYGIPANYWQSTVDQKKGPVFIKQLQKAGYQTGIFASASLLFPQFNKNVFVDIKPLRTDTKGDTSVARDKRITKLFNQFVTKRNKSKPFFGFIFYDAIHNYCEGSAHEHMTPFEPAIAQCARFSLTAHTNPTPYTNRYHNAAYFLDQQAEKVIAKLKQQHLLKNTIVVVTADHGEQQNDQHMDYWSHASAYTPYQLHIPMLIYWPGMKPQRRDYFATNFDVVPTLMKKVLNCQNPLRDYTVGKSLFTQGGRPYFISGSYTDYAYVTPKQITRVYPGGDYTLNGPLGHHQYRAALDIPLLKKAGEQLTRYYR
ncbi:MAG: phosphoglycerol transferase [Coxiella sp. (in: Bacteria)]|nr:MAG: phosphoglycerol transferase [Coxiella sp. (in: g-proteobacteria)]